MTLLRFAFIALLVTFSAPAYSASSYFDAGIIPPTLMDPPPAVESDEWKQEVIQIIALQKHVSAQDIDEAKAERSVHIEMLTQAAVPELTEEKYPALYLLLERAGETSKLVTDNVKDYWKTRRPYIMDKRIKALVMPHDNPSYPSGHTVSGYVWAYVLGMVAPDQRKKFFDRAEIIAQHRVMVGMHYPHDIRGGKQLALIIIGGLLQNAEFQADLAKAQQEMRSAGYPASQTRH